MVGKVVRKKDGWERAWGGLAGKRPTFTSLLRRYVSASV